MWILDRTSTKFGARLFRSWVGKPLVDSQYVLSFTVISSMTLTTLCSALRERTEAVEEILSNKSPKLAQLRELLRRLPDLARGLCRIQYGKCTPQELVVLLKAFHRVSTTFSAPHPSQPPPGTNLKSKLLKGVVEALPKLRDPVRELCDAIVFKEAEEGRKDTMWNDIDKYPGLESLTLVSQLEATRTHYIKTPWTGDPSH